MRIQCPHCGVRLTVPDNAQGKKGRCPGCKGTVLIEAPATVQAQTSEPAPRTGAEPVSAGVGALGSPLAAGEMRKSSIDPISPVPLDSSDSAAAGSLGVPVVPAEPPHDDDGEYGLEAADEVPSVSALPLRAGVEPPKKSKRQKAEEIEDLKAEGSRYLLRIRLLLLILGALMVVYNIFAFTTIDATITLFKDQVTTNSKGTVDRAKLESVAHSLKIAMTFEASLYLAMGIGLAVLAALVHKFPLVATWGALGVYVGAWLLDIALIQATLGDLAAGMAIFNFGTLIKIGIIGGLWHGVQVGRAYDEQVVKPQRELSES